MSQSSAPQGQVSLEDLSLQQLDQVGKQLDDELKHLTNAFASLKAAQAKFTACIESLDAVKPANKDKKILIPLTSSLYVPGKLKDTENVLVDVGTGYYVEKPTKAAKTLYNGKILTLKSNISASLSFSSVAWHNARAVQEMMRIKQAQAMQAAKAQGGVRDD
ncbi:hypothetical protein MNV49_006977 [Pseudohyphozyma bogoriensis]|nr:hypothetical protein MNV49_006977 [Pseudohyphozyma bogoriensis]